MCTEEMQYEINDLVEFTFFGEEKCGNIIDFDLPKVRIRDKYRTNRVYVINYNDINHNNGNQKTNGHLSVLAKIIKSSFITCNSNGSEKHYAIEINFESLKKMQECHRLLIDIALADK